MQCFYLLKNITHHLDKINKDFFGKNSNTGRGFPPFAWNIVCLPKNKRGLNLQKSEAVNTVFQYKLAWKLIMNDSGLWPKSMKAKYLHNIKFFTCKKRNANS